MNYDRKYLKTYFPKILKDFKTKNIDKMLKKLEDYILEPKKIMILAIGKDI